MAGTNFAQKNQKRREAYREARDENSGQALDARDGRRARGGAFGNETAGVFNALAFGTSATPREVGGKK